MAADRAWVVISYFSGVDALACSHHLDDRIPHLCALGVDPVVVSSVCSPAGGACAKVRVPSVAPSGLRYELRYLTRRRFANSTIRRLVQTPPLLALLPGYAIEKLVLNLDSTWSWFPLAALAATKSARAHGAELIYSTGGPASAHLAAYLCALRTGLPWIAEYQDPIAGAHIPGARMEIAAHARLERLIAGRADAVVFMTRTALESANERSSLGHRGRFIYPGAGPAASARVGRRGETLVLGHFGSLGGDRNLEVVLRALEELVAGSPAAEREVRLLLVGDMDRAQRSVIEGFAHPQMIEIRGKVSRAESLRAMGECDLLLLVQNANSHSAVSIPSKAYEYMQIGAPVLGLTYGNSELSSMLTGLGHLAQELSDAQAVSGCLQRIYADWKEGLRLASPLLPSPYTVAAAAGALVELAEEVCARTRGAGPAQSSRKVGQGA